MRTIRSYTDSVGALSRYLASQDLTDDVESTGTPELRAFLAAEAECTSPASAAVHYGNRVCSSAGSSARASAPTNPLESVDKPKTPEDVPI